MASWLATVLGLAGGVALALAVARTAFPGLIRASRNPRLAARMAFAGTLVALLPATLLGVVAGGTLGAAWGRQTSTPLGIAVGTALAFAVLVLFGAAAGLVLARLKRGTEEP